MLKLKIKDDTKDIIYNICELSELDKQNLERAIELNIIKARYTIN